MSGDYDVLGELLNSVKKVWVDLSASTEFRAFWSGKLTGDLLARIPFIDKNEALCAIAHTPPLVVILLALAIRGWWKSRKRKDRKDDRKSAPRSAPSMGEPQTAPSLPPISGRRR